MLQIHLAIAPALAAATVRMDVSVQSAVSDDFEGFSYDSTQVIASLVDQAPGTPLCSGVAEDMHRIIRQHVDSSDACMHLKAEASSVSSSKSEDRIVLFLEVTRASAIASTAQVEGDVFTYDSTNLTMIGAAAMEVSMTICLDIDGASAAGISTLQNTAVPCLDSLSHIDLQGNWTSAQRVIAPEVQTLPLQNHLQVSVQHVSSTAEQCNESSPADMAIDEAVAVVEDSHMQQLMIENLVRPSQAVSPYLWARKSSNRQS